MKKMLRVSLWVLVVALGLVLGLLLTAWLAMRASLPQLNGEISGVGFKSTLSVARDAQGTVTITSKDTPDAMRALGFVHAQERFFEMDLTRRSAAGELSALFGEATIKIDKDKRAHRLRARMAAKWPKLSGEDRALISIYTEGVNAGLASLSARPWQYFVLRASPEPWREVDSLLVIGEMYAMLQSRSIEDRLNEALLRRQIGDRVFDWMKPSGGSWDAALDGSVMVSPPLPGADVLNTRKGDATTLNAAVTAPSDDTSALIGSNNWAIGGALSSHGGAIFANDMHLTIGVPNIWFRTQFNIGEGISARRTVGVTLPGAPGMIAGSNGHIAWGFTNGYGQWFDWVEIAADSPLRQSLKTARESIAVKGGTSVDIDVRETAFGPILRTIGTTDYALSWTLYREGGVNAGASRIMAASTIDEAIATAHESGSPHQNLVVVDNKGNIAWTIMGRIPAYAEGVRRGTFTSAEALPTTWLASDKYPTIKNPPDHRLWTANNRQLGGVGGNIIGDGGFDLGARGGQIRDRLREPTVFDEQKLYAIQLDNESRFLKRWAALAITAATAKPNDKTTALANQLQTWNGRADIEQTGHRIARAFRQQVQDQLWKSWLAAAQGDRPSVIGSPRQNDPDGRFEYAAWAALEARPVHLLPQPFSSWDDFLAAQLANVFDDLTRVNATVADATWGKRNTSNIRHPFTRAMPFLGRFLDMPKAPQAGDNHMPLVAAPTFGASERMVVSPGKEELGILVMPGGQSGHILSPFYGAGHDDWARGRPGKLLAGETLHTLRFSP